MKLPKDKILEILEKQGPQSPYDDPWTEEHHVAFAQAVLEAARARATELSVFDELMQDLEVAVAETAVFNAAQRSMAMRIVRPRSASVREFIARAAVRKFVADLVARLSNRQPAGFVMKHKTGPDRGFSWNANDKQFSADWIRIPAFIEENEKDQA